MAAWLLPVDVAVSAALEIVDPGQGPVAIESGSSDISELSGIAFAGDDLYYAVSDNSGRLVALRITVDPTSGRVGAATAGPTRKLAAGYDLEGIALADAGAVFVCDEVVSVIRKHRLDDGALIAQLALPNRFRRFRPNLGIESLTRAGDSLWTANEEALRSDGPTATEAAGTRVRVQRLGRDGTPSGQWAYETDPYPGAPLFGQAFSGVADLLALPGGELLALERSFSSHGFRARIYQIDFRGATDTTERESLAGGTLVSLRERRLWDSTSFGANFEGITLGPRLASGGSSLLLVADDGGAGRSLLYALILRPEHHAGPPPPRGSR